MKPIESAKILRNSKKGHSCFFNYLLFLWEIFPVKPGSNAMHKQSFNNKK